MTQPTKHLDEDNRVLVKHDEYTYKSRSINHLVIKNL